MVELVRQPILKPSKMVKKKKKPKPINYQKKADALLQEIGRNTYDCCEICGGTYSCLHHYVLKSQSNALRYSWINLIPICKECHSSIHLGLNDVTAGKVVVVRGNSWLYELEVEKKQGVIDSKNGMFKKSWFQEKYYELKNTLEIMKR